MNKSGFTNGDQLHLRGFDRQRHSITPGSPQSVGIRPQHNQNSTSLGQLQHQEQPGGQQQQGQIELKTQNDDQPQNTSPPKDHRSRSGSRTLKDLFRFRRKSIGTPTGSEFSLPDASNQPALSTSASPSNAQGSNSSPKRQRSKSTVVPPSLQAISRPHVIPSAVPPIRQRFAKDNFPKWTTPDSNANPTIVISGVTSSSAPLSTSPPSSLTPMSRILQANLGEGRDERRRLSIGPAEFMELYRNRTSSDPRQVEARLALAKVRNRKLQLTNLDTPAPADRVPSPEERIVSPTRQKVPLTSPDSRSSIPDTIPEHVEVHHGSRNQLLPGSDRMRKRSSGVTSGSHLLGESAYSRRRASEPVKPNLMQLAHLNSIRMQSAADCQMSSESLGGQSGTESNRSNSGSRRVSPSSLGICYPLAPPQKYLIWRDEETGTTIYKLPSPQGDESDRIADLEFSENLLYVKLMKRHRCYELMPQSSKLILFEKELPVIEAFHALMYNGIRAAPIWDSNISEYVGMLTVTDFIQVLLNFYEYPEKMEELENHKISTWRELLFRDSDWWETNNSQSDNGESRRRRFSGNEALVCADSDDSLFDAITKLHKYNFHRLLVTDMVENNALYILTYKRILYFICLLTDDLQEPSFMSRSIGELDIGTYNNLTTITPETKLIDALTLLVERRISAIPVIDEDHKIVNIYAKEDALNLVNDGLYKKLDNTVHCALESQRECFEGIYLCRRSDSLAQIIEWIVKENVHRLLVVDEEERLEGLISLFDIVNFLVLRQADDDLDDIQPGDVEAEMQI